MSRKKMEALARGLKTMYLTENPANIGDDDYGYKYFICFNNTGRVAARSKSIHDMIQKLENIIENGVDVDGHIFY